ncbi:hypothetical protein CH275_11980 [Rhodococcus sp. 06-235-1A]|uniref:2OG-Fe(II) oxygenase n=1 Tax=Rhodococcus sp. 06-235-1A TaxID=2022508 RepID=UPI000B9B7CD4|nr:2OG-Fe(II) oxygenase [Rhodococcus sp. 06-235-1A]OZD05088.1 hypothetical protein CH275_11980 [Rhodococcus sp. 06-235-1A]
MPASLTNSSLPDTRSTPVMSSSERFPAVALKEATLRELLLSHSTNALHHLPKALPEWYCDAAVAAMGSLSFDAYEKTVGSEDYDPILKYGPTVFDYAGGHNFTEYFTSARDDAERGSRAFAAAGVANPQSIALRALRRAWGGEVHIAVEPDDTGPYRPYFAGVIRDIAGGALPHVDDAATETPELAIGNVVAQASLLFYLQVPAEGGGLRVYDRTATEEDWAKMRGYGFDPSAVAGRTFNGVTPGVGSAVLFRTTQIHSVDPVIGAGRRVTWSTFIGLTESGDLILWS